jgi:hypothetical protein
MAVVMDCSSLKCCAAAPYHRSHWLRLNYFWDASSVIDLEAISRSLPYTISAGLQWLQLAIKIAPSVGDNKGDKNLNHGQEP